MSPEMRDAFDFTKHLRGLVPGPHKIWVANPELSKTIVPTGAYFQSASTLSKAEIEIATCVICGHWRAAYSSFEHEKIGVHLGHLDPAKCAALVAGLQSVHSRS
jgi:4-carboxymuconolactone decarboxylase